MTQKRTYIIGMAISGFVSISIQAGCLVLDAEHCLANGGDLACGGRHCLLQTGPNAVTKSDDIGCAYHGPAVPDFHLPLTYGLPFALEMGGDGTNLDTVHGILVALREEHGIERSCKLNDAQLQDELDELESVSPEIFDFRARIEKSGRVRKDTAKITEEDVSIVFDYNDAVEAWVEACLEVAASEPQ